jgi:hypothetical protein
MIQNCRSRLRDVARLVRSGEDDCGGNRYGISRITGSLTSSHPLTLHQRSQRTGARISTKWMQA